MIPEIGNVFLIFAFSISVLSFLSANYSYYADTKIYDLSKNIFLVFFLLLASFLILEFSFLTDDFSVLYVANNSNPNLPAYYKFSALWGGHEGSLLLFVLIISIWMMVFSLLSSYTKIEDKNLVLSFCYLVLLSLLGFIIFSSNPFERLIPIASMSGTDLNPLLQDFAFTIHPPILYFGYAGLVIPFSLALARCFNVKEGWTMHIRNWTVLSWSFLTLGIALGSWWAYYELGWGGWWFWDPVENSSLVPWLLATALFHSAVVSNSRKIFNNWTILLSILSIIGCFIGMFLVRSGILTSVHSFALDPERGLILLLITLMITLYSFFIFFKSDVSDNNSINYSIVSKEYFLLINNLFLVVLAVIILFGTVYPIFYEIFSGGKTISVGAPYFNLVTVPIAFFLAFFQGYGVLTKWSASPNSIRTFSITLIVIIFISLTFSYLVFNYLSLFNVIGIIMVSSIIGGVIISALRTIDNKKLFFSALGMNFAHIGIAVTIFGIGVVSSHSSSKEVILEIGESTTLSNYEFTLIAEDFKEESNFYSQIAIFQVENQNNGKTFDLKPEKAFYPSSRSIMTESAIAITPKEDVYISLSERLDSGEWIAKIQTKPFVRFIWLGAILMCLGGIFSFSRRLLFR
tara:strand:+ start:1725 stop:3617 length:1893 start_codon:yes stop_codon:yes gene_type:complete